MGGKSVAEWKVAITMPEFGRWVEFYRRYPFDDFHRFHRPAAMIAAAFDNGEVQSRLDWLMPDRNTEGLTDADMATMRAFGFTRKGEL